MSEMKVLLVDDEKNFVHALAERLQLRDLKNETVFSGEEAMAFMDDKEPDVMVLDLKMPGINGIEVLRQVKEQYAGIQVIILTGTGSAQDEEEARELGIFDYLHKPVDIDSLAGRIREAYQNKIKKQ